MSIYLAVDSLEYLKRGGRISGSTAAIGSLLNIKPILKFDVGLLEVYKKSRGFNKAKKEMIEAMKEELNTRFKSEYEAGEVHLLAASSASDEDTEQWVEEIKENFPGMEVMCDNLSFGVSCHIGPGGLGIGCSCKPVE
jgi:DegV family protein with EDD domain